MEQTEQTEASNRQKSSGSLTYRALPWILPWTQGQDIFPPLVLWALRALYVAP